MAEHAWCRSPSRDEAVRAAEDGREGPLPTLAEAIAAVTDRRPVEPGGGGNVTGLRTERVTLDAKLAPAANADGGSNHAAPAASGAAGTEVVAWAVVYPGGRFGASFDTEAQARSLAKRLSLYELSVAPLYAAPQPAKGWLTEEEREAVLWLAEFAGQRCGLPWPCGMGGSFPVVAHRLVAREKPPEVVAPASYAVSEQQPPRDLEWIAALAAAGVTVKEVGA